MRDTFNWKSATRIALGTLILAATGCASSDEGEPATPPSETPSGGDDDPVSAEIGALGATVTGCTTGTDLSPLALTLMTDAVVLSAPNGKLTVNGNPCSQTATSTALTTTTTSKITITGTAGDDKVILDLLPGSFGSKILSAMGGITVDFSTGGKDTFMLRGSGAAENVRFASTNAASPAAADDPSARVPGDSVYVDLTGDKTADVQIKTGTNVADTLNLTASMGGGADTVVANSVTGDLTAFGTTPIRVRTLQLGVTAYGGLGDDKFTGGIGNDTFYGGDGDDTFRMAATTDGADIYQGDANNDTVDYGNRTGNLTVSIGPAAPTLIGTVDLSSAAALSTWGASGTLDGVTFNVLTGVLVIPVTLTAPTDGNDVVTQINGACGAGCAASLTALGFIAVTSSIRATTLGSTINYVDTNNATNLFGTAPNPVVDVLNYNLADDGLANEKDDVRASVENITGGNGNDNLLGSPGKNTIKGGAGDDTIEGGGVTGSTCPNNAAANADTLQGEAGNDTFLVPQLNCFAVLAGAAGADSVDFSARTPDLQLSNDSTANDGEFMLANSVVTLVEKLNIGSDIERITGGAGKDTITGGAGDDILLGGPNDDNLIGGAGADTLTGGAGNDFVSGGMGADIMISGAGTDVYNGGADFDKLDFGLETAPVTVTLCVTTATDKAGTIAATNMGGCGAAGDDGPTGENDNVANIEWLIGGAGIDTFTAHTTAAIDVTFEGGADDDVLTGGPGNDTLWGDGDDDQLFGLAGDDTLSGDGGADRLNGGLGEGDLCTNDTADTTMYASTARVACEL